MASEMKKERLSPFTGNCLWRRQDCALPPSRADGVVCSPLRGCASVDSLAGGVLSGNSVHLVGF